MTVQIVSAAQSEAKHRADRTNERSVEPIHELLIALCKHRRPR